MADVPALSPEEDLKLNIQIAAEDPNFHVVDGELYHAETQEDLAAAINFSKTFGNDNGYSGGCEND